MSVESAMERSNDVLMTCFCAVSLSGRRDRLCLCYSNETAWSSS